MGRESENELLGVEDVAGLLRVKETTVRKWCNEGTIPCLKVGKHWRSRREALEDFLRRNEGTHPRIGEQLLAFMASMPAHVAVVDQKGAILAVNGAWRSFARANGGDPGKVAEGANYLAVCDGAKGKQSGYAAAFAEGLRAVLSRREGDFEVEYPCHSPTERRWYVGAARPLKTSGSPLAVVTHDDTTERELLKERLRQFS
jgi:excisionase family DNA binding protein